MQRTLADVELREGPKDRGHHGDAAMLQLALLHPPEGGEVPREAAGVEARVPGHVHDEVPVQGLRKEPKRASKKLFGSLRKVENQVKEHENG